MKIDQLYVPLICQHGSESQDDGNIQAGTVDDMATKESSAPTKEQVVYYQVCKFSCHYHCLISILCSL
jgi:hypothetical protein